MAELGRILLADDEETFLQATADILRREGYACDCASDAREAAEMLKAGSYELLIADIKMPGNPELELIKGLPDTVQGLPVILVTGYPSIRSATESIQLPVAAYMVKPIEVAELLQHVRPAIERYRVYRMVCESRERIEALCQELEGLEEIVRQPARSGGQVSAAAFVDLSVRNIINTVSDMRHVSRAGTGLRSGERACHLLSCPHLDTLTGALEETVEVLRETKGSFKSKALGELRKKLETVLRDSRHAEPVEETVSGSN